MRPLVLFLLLLTACATASGRTGAPGEKLGSVVIGAAIMLLPSMLVEFQLPQL